jgi:cytochrome c peroxidase
MRLSRLLTTFAITSLAIACVPPAGDGDAGPGDAGATDPEQTPDGGNVDAGADEPEADDAGTPPTLNELLRSRLSTLSPPLEPLPPIEPHPEALVALGEALFFDPILSGNKDTSCASCHHPAFATSDGMALAVGTGATGVGPQRSDPGYPGFLSRHSPQLFNLGQPGFDRLFWDARVERLDSGELRTPVGDDPLAGLSGVLAAQALIPLIDRNEMRGDVGDVDVTGEPNELAAIDDEDPQAVWAALLDRLLALDAYQALFAAAFPDVPEDDLTFAHAVNAIAAYEATAFEATATPWDAYLAGDDSAIPEAAKLGALLFYGSAGCVRCHSGPLLTDHQIHNVGVVQLGPGRPGSAPFDTGRALVTGEEADRFGFRTPSLRNVTRTAPYMHNGALEDLQDVVRHYGNPLTAIEGYDPTWLHPDLVDTVQTDEAHIADITSTLSDDLPTTPQFVGLANIIQFLEVLTDPSVDDLPDAVPEVAASGLPIASP